jgi:phosphoribosylanthranilate isomerase
VTAVKFCGLTRRHDADYAARLGADYCGVIFVVGGPRRVTVSHAAEILPPGVTRVGVFGIRPREEIASIAASLALDVVQLHADPTVADVERVRAYFGGAVWAAIRAAGADLPPRAADLFAAADAVLLEAHVRGALGGTGTALPWAAIAPAVERARGATGRLVLAGGLNPDNVAGAIGILSPDVVDVSSGVERSPGVKDHARMQAFAAAAHLGLRTP